MTRPRRSVSDEQYGIASQRVLHYENLLWQAPVLALTGQAFLLPAAFDVSIHPVWRAATSLLSIAVSIGTLKLVSHHTAYTENDKEIIRRFEAESIDAGDAEQPIHGYVSITPRNIADRLGASSTTAMWTTIIWLFMIVHAAHFTSVISELLGWTLSKSWMFPPA